MPRGHTKTARFRYRGFQATAEWDEEQGGYQVSASLDGKHVVTAVGETVAEARREFRRNVEEWYQSAGPLDPWGDDDDDDDDLDDLQELD